MNQGANRHPSANSPDLPDWTECDCFCIHDYARAGTSACGWRGNLQDARRDPTGTRFLCPRCGGATLFRIPSDMTDPPER